MIQSQVSFRVLQNHSDAEGKHYPVQTSALRHPSFSAFLEAGGGDSYVLFSKGSLGSKDRLGFTVKVSWGNDCSFAMYEQIEASSFLITERKGVSLKGGGVGRS